MDNDRRGRMAAQFEQVAAEGRDLADDPGFAAVAVAWREATAELVRVLRASGVPPEALTGTVLGLTADLVAGVRDDG